MKTKTGASLLVDILGILILVVGLVACGGGGDSGPEEDPVDNLSGIWSVTEQGTSNCPGEATYTNEYTVTLLQSGNTITVTAPAGVFTGTIEGNHLSWTGSYSEDGGITTITALSLTVSPDGNTLTGTSSWTWTDGTSSCSGTNEAVTASRLLITPAAPDNLAATALSGTEVELGWIDKSDNETGFKIERSTSSSSGFVQIALLAANQNTHTDVGLNPGTTYYYRVRAYNGDGDSAYSNISSATTDPAPVSAPSAPENLSATATSDSTINLNWTHSADDETGFKIERSTSSVTGFAQIGTTVANSTSFDDSGLEPATTYYYRVLASNDAGDSAYSNVAGTTTQPVPTAPAAPSSLSATATSDSTIRLSWTDKADDETGFEIERSLFENSGFVLVGTGATDSTNFDDVSLESATTYYYRVRATNDAGDSAYSNTASATTEAVLAAPLPPSDLAVTAVSENSVGLSWIDNADNESGFNIHMATNAAGPFDVAAQVGPDASTVFVENLLPATLYYFKVEAFNDAGPSGFSNTVNATTSAASTPPAAPGNVTVLNVTESSARLVWTDVAVDETSYEVGTCSGLVSVTGDGLYRCNSGFSPVASLPANGTNYIFSSLSPATGYVRYVRAVNDAGASSAYGRSFTTLAVATTADFYPAVVDGWTYSNLMMIGSLDATLENTAYPGSFPQVGCNWSYDWLFESYTQNFVCGRSAFDFYLTDLVGKTILSATLTLEADLVPLDRSRQYRLRAIASTWHPSTLTWNSVLTSYSTSEIIFDPPLYAGEQLVFDVTQTVQNWTDGTWDSYGFLLDMPDLSFPYDTRWQASQFNLPKLTVTYQ